MMTQYCTFELGPLLLGVEARHVQEVLRAQPITTVPLAPDFVRGMMNLRGQIAVVIDLRKRLDARESPDPLRPINVLLNTKSGLISVQTDRIGDVLTAESDSVHSVPDTLQGRAREVLVGAMRLPDRLLLLLDPERIAVT
jgi:purine-binding chemotaxis protein CheW